MKTLSITLFSWVFMCLAVLGFALALSFDQDGLLQTILIQFRDLASFGNLLLLALSALPFAFLLSQSWTFLGLMAKGFWQGFLSNALMVICLFLFIVAMAVVPDFNILTAAMPYVNYVFLCFGILTATYSLSALLLAYLLTMLLGLLLGMINFRIWKSI